MPRKKTPKPKTEEQEGTGAATTQPARNPFAKLFAKTNRGLLLDIVVFVANIFLMRLLTSQFIELFSEMDTEDQFAKLSLGLVFSAMWILPAACAPDSPPSAT